VRLDKEVIELRRNEMGSNPKGVWRPSMSESNRTSVGNINTSTCQQLADIIGGVVIAPQKLINKLIFLNLYNKQQLYEMTLSKLEYEYKRYKSQNHPHGEFGSIKWV